MSDQVRNPEDRFSHTEAHIFEAKKVYKKKSLNKLSLAADSVKTFFFCNSDILDFFLKTEKMIFCLEKKMTFCRHGNPFFSREQFKLHGRDINDRVVRVYLFKRLICLTVNDESAVFISKYRISFECP